MSGTLPYLFAQTKRGLLVEDNFTRECLLELFPESQSWLTIVVVGSKHAVKHLAKEWKYEFHDVSITGWCDRDFQVKSQDGSFMVLGDVFIGARHEFENYLLNWNAIHACSLNKKWTPQTLIDAIKMHAQDMCWQLACCKEIASLHIGIQNGFPSHPKVRMVSNEEEAVDYICKQTWIENIKCIVNDKLNPDQIRSKMKQFHDAYKSDLQSDGWIKSFPGKELFKQLCQTLFQDASLQKRLDFAKTICRWCYENNQVPEELVSFMNILKNR